MSIADKLTTIAENVPQVHQTGYVKGYQQGYTEGEEIGFGDGWWENEYLVVGELENPKQKIMEYVPNAECNSEDSVGIIRYIDENLPQVYENGQKSEYDKFWDAYLASMDSAGVINMYKFCGGGWNDTTFYPTKDLVVKYGYMWFYYSRITNLRQRLIDCGVKFDFSKATDLGGFLENSSITEAPEIDLSALSANKYPTKGQRLCYNCKSLVTIEKIKTSEDVTYGNDFVGCSALENITIEGVIGNDINFQYSPLSKESILGRVATEEQIAAGTNIVELNGVKYWGGIIAALKADASGKTLTLNKAAVNKAFGINVDDNTTFPEGSEYYILRHSKDNWNFNYS